MPGLQLPHTLYQTLEYTLTYSSFPCESQVPTHRTLGETLTVVPEFNCFTLQEKNTAKQFKSSILMCSKRKLACKQHFRAPEIDAHLLGRGYERINLDRIAELFRIIDDPSNKNFGDVETERRVQQQRGQQKLQDTDKILRITGHVTLGGKSKARTKFKCYWNRPAILTKEKMLKKKAVNPKKDSDLRDLERDQARFETEETERTEDHETWQFYTEIISMNGGSDAMSVYEELHPKAAAKFRK